MNHYETEERTPQGGIFSPLLCNRSVKWGREEGKRCTSPRRGINAGVHLIRYAEDIVVTGKNPDILKECRETIGNFLIERGLELSDKKTKITPIV